MKKNHCNIYSSLSTPADKNPVQMFVLQEQQQEGELQSGVWMPQKKGMCLKRKGQQAWQGGWGETWFDTDLIETE